MNIDAIKDLLFRLADDDLILGHRHSEWNGLGPIIEEDIAFSSMAQDEIGHAHAYYQMMHEFMGGDAPDQVAFNRKAADFKSCQFVEYPNGDYAFSLVRHYLYDLAESVRLENLSRSSFKPLAELAKKLFREEKYHILHAKTWIAQLSNATAESNRRMQEALNQAWPLAFSLFEPGNYSKMLAQDGIMATEQELENNWRAMAAEELTAAGLVVPGVENPRAHDGGRTGKHTSHLQPLLDEMTEVFAIDTTATW